MNKNTLKFAAVISLGVLLSGCGSKSDGTETKAPPVSANAVPDPTNTGKTKSAVPAAAPTTEVAK